MGGFQVAALNVPAVVRITQDQQWSKTPASFACIDSKIDRIWLLRNEFDGSTLMDVGVYDSLAATLDLVCL
jgi:hypothetical protein